jgi:hypothetical protein
MNDSGTAERKKIQCADDGHGEGKIRMKERRREEKREEEGRRIRERARGREDERRG